MIETANHMVYEYIERVKKPIPQSYSLSGMPFILSYLVRYVTDKKTIWWIINIGKTHKIISVLIAM